MSDTPARDADWMTEVMAHEAAITPLAAEEATAWVPANPDLTVAALIESGWRPDDDQLRAMGGQFHGVEPRAPGFTSAIYSFPRTEEVAEVDPRCKPCPDCTRSET